MKPETWLVVAGRPAPEPGAPLNTPIVPASTYIAGSERIYSRNEGAPGWEAFEELLGGLEGGEAVAFSSGMAACAAVLGQLGSEAHLVLVDDCYQGVAEIAAEGVRAHRWRVERLAATDPRWLERASEADLLWLESPSNPLLEVADLAAICAVPRRPGTRVVVDNTFATPLLQRPLELGADIVVHSATKLIGGHSDLLLGAAVTGDLGQLATLRAARGRNGATPGTLEVFLALRGARTLSLRLRQAQDSARRLAERLAGHPSRHPRQVPRLRHDRQLRARGRGGGRSRLCKDRDRPSRDEPGRDRDLDGAPGRASRPGAHSRRLDQAQRGLREPRGCVGRPRRRASRWLKRPTDPRPH